MPTLATFIQHSTGSPRQRYRQEKEMKGLHFGREQVKLPLLVHDILYTENPKDSTKKLLELNNIIYLT